MNILAAPILVPLIAAAICLSFPHRLRIQRLVSGIASHALVFLAAYLLHRTRGGEVLVLRLGGWPATYGIVFALDLFASIMLCLTALTQLASWWYTVAGAIRHSQEVRYFHPLFLLIIAGVNWSFVTADLFNLFVSFELILIANYVLLIHSGGRGAVSEGMKFAVINIIGGTFFLAAAGLTYGVYGTLNFADLAVKVAQTTKPNLAIAIGTLLLVIFAIKAALFPVFFWLPDAYPKAPLGVLPFFAGILTKVGVYCLYRVLTLIYGGFFDQWFQPVLLAIAACTMLFGVLGALGRNTFRHILSFHIISQIGYMIFGLGLFSPLGLAGGIFYIIHHIIVKSSLFLVAGCVILGAGTDHLGRIGGVVRSHPILAISFLAAALSLAGIPPLSGFYGKYALIVDGFAQNYLFYTIISVVTSFLTLASMIKIWNGSFWGEEFTQPPLRSSVKGVIAATCGLVSVSLLVAILSGPIMNVATDAANALLKPDAYVDAVLGDWHLAEAQQ